MIPLLVVPTLTRHDLLERMLRSVDEAVQRLVVIDNSGRGLDLPDGPWDEADVLRMPANLGVAASWNLAIRMGHRNPWVMICSDDVTWPEGAMRRLAEDSAEDRLTLSETWPHWCAFTIGMGVVSRVGLFDEGYFPAYFEDTEYERRLEGAGISPTLSAAVGHQNASTLNTPGAEFGVRNRASYAANEALYMSGEHHGFDPFRWRRQAW
ncbi:MAG TPA: hypothetical protein VIG24_11035 [Acidimicrobiia bacterium]